MRLVAIGLVSLALLLLGGRLLRQSLRGGQQPERWLGLAFGCAGASAWLLPLAASELVAHDQARALALGAQVGLTAAVSFLVVFAWRVFRTRSARARGLALLLIGANVAACGAVLASGAAVPVGPLGLAVVATRSAALLWLFVESAIQTVRMRRRLAIGLGDPVVANRFLLWSVWTGALALIPVFVLVLRAAGALEAPVPGEPLPMPMRAALAALGSGGAIAVVAGWLAFFPPVAYLRWLTTTRPGLA